MCNSQLHQAFPVIIYLQLTTESFKTNEYTQRGRSRAQHVRDRKADVEGGKNFGPGAFATLERVVFSCKGAERDEWRGPKGLADALAVVVLWQKDDRVARPVGPSRRAHFRGV